jgi:HlyD family secretion protein
MSRLTKILAFAAAVGAMALVGGLAVSGKLPFIKKPIDTAKAAPAASNDTMLAAAVSVETVTIENFAEILSVTGTLVARDEILVGPEVEGLRIVEVLADEGDKVKKGQILARLVSDTLDAQVAQNDAGLAKAAAAIAQAKGNVIVSEAKLVETKNAYERGKPLRQSGYLSEALMDQRESAFKSAQAQVAVSKDAMKLSEAEKAQVEAQRREINFKRSRTDIPSPADGVISRRLARVGGFASGAGDAMFRIIAKGEIEMEADVPETRLTRLREGQRVKMDIEGIADLTGKVRLVSPEVDKASRLGRIRILLGENPGLRIGSFARGSITVETSRGLAVPASAILYTSTGATVQVVKDGRVEVRPVKLGLSSGGRTEVREGLSERDLVVAKSGTFLRDGDAVRPIMPSTTAAVDAAKAAAPQGGVKP